MVVDDNMRRLCFVQTNLGADIVLSDGVLVSLLVSALIGNNPFLIPNRAHFSRLL